MKPSPPARGGRRLPPRGVVLVAAALALIILPCCASQPAGSTATREKEEAVAKKALETQALAMNMADEYITGLEEAVYVLAQNGKQDPKARTLSQSFLRGGVGAAIDIGSGPNPSVAILDLLVLASLQTWAFETHWMPGGEMGGVGEAAPEALARLKRAEADLWQAAAEGLTPEQLATVRRLIDAWIAEHPDRTIVSLVRFNDFRDERKMSTASLRSEAGGILREVSEASQAIDDVRLLGERAMWFASRYPLVLGEQATLSAFRLASQPEALELGKAFQGIDELSKSASGRIEELRRDLQAERESVFEQLAAERKAAIEQARVALEESVQKTLADATDRLAAERQIAIDQFFQSFAAERKLLLDDVEKRQAPLREAMNGLTETMAASTKLSAELTKTVEAVDRVVARFDPDAKPGGGAMKLTDVRDAAAEAKQAAEQLTKLLERTNELAASKDLDRRVESLAQPAKDVVDRMFWRGVILVVLLIVGLGAVRMLPARGRERAKG